MGSLPPRRPTPRRSASRSPARQPPRPPPPRRRPRRRPTRRPPPQRVHLLRSPILRQSFPLELPTQVQEGIPVRPKAPWRALAVSLCSLQEPQRPRSSIGVGRSDRPISNESADHSASAAAQDARHLLAGGGRLGVDARQCAAPE